MEVAILSFFTRHDPFFHHAKFQLPLRPPSTFLGVFWNCWQILSSKIFLIFFLCKIWVIAAPNKHFLGVWYQKWMRNKLLLLHFFSTFLNPQRTTLTYSALVNIDTLVDSSLVLNIEEVIFLKYTQVHFDVLVQYSMLLAVQVLYRASLPTLFSKRNPQAQTGVKIE